ncbi:peptidylprolyl isomerase [Liquorilactobacillus sicerae]|uniref:peptidylprolyl isomerase n=1 Tax=Liquorilactobacillus sicerae TaxID=1416943 RepID=UPI00248153C1|nr:peptidylprolyl isomerase [Liquorilactobacillus sicerae]
MFPQLAVPSEGTPKVQLKTTLGEIEFELFSAYAPKTVENFCGLIKKGYYTNVVFHRVIKDFMIQSGDPTGTGRGGESIWQQPFADEFSNQLFNFRGALSMANAGPNTNGSQFFIVQNKNLPAQMEEQMKIAGYPAEVIQQYLQGGTPWLDHRHTVFGQVRKGLTVVDQIANVKTVNDRPQADIVIEEAVIL